MSTLLFDRKLPSAPFAGLTNFEWFSARERALETHANPTDEQILHALEDLEEEWASAGDEIYPEEVSA
jgi:hypothetical protein